jgi:2-isopropylmalate synthase
MAISLPPDRTSDPDRVFLFDTTLRVAVQPRGRSITQAKKLRIAGALANLGVDVIEAGYPAASKDEWEAINAIANETQGTIICAVARCERDDIELAAKALRKAPQHRIRVCLATGGGPSQYPLNNEDQILRNTIEGVRIARDLCEDVEFSTQDAFRIEHPFLAEVVEAAGEAGANSVNIPDPAGDRLPDEVSELYRYLHNNVRGVDRIRLSVHCQDALGLATANSLAAIVAGARQVECGVTSGGHQGTCNLEQLVMTLNAREAFLGVSTGIHPDRLHRTLQVVASLYI